MNISELGRTFWQSPCEHLTRLDTTYSLAKFASSIIQKAPMVSEWAFCDNISTAWLSYPVEVAACCLKTTLVMKHLFKAIDENTRDEIKALNQKIISTLALIALSALPYTLFAFTRTFSNPATALLQATFSSLNINSDLRSRLTVSWASPATHRIKSCFALHQILLNFALMFFSERTQVRWLIGDTTLRLGLLFNSYLTPWIKLEHRLPETTIDLLMPGASPEKEAFRSSKLFPLVRNHYVQAPVNGLINDYSLFNRLGIENMTSNHWLFKKIYTIYSGYKSTLVNTITPLLNSLTQKAINIETALSYQLSLPPRILKCPKCIGQILAPLKLLAAAE